MTKLLGIKQLCEFCQSIKGMLGNKVDKVPGMGLSSNDYTTAEKTKLAGIEAGAEANVQSDWNTSDATSDAYIQNKPSIPAAGSATPLMDGTAAVGTSSNYARQDHRHPTDTTRVAKAGDTMTGNLTISKTNPTAVYQSTNLDSAVGETVPADDTAFGGVQISDMQGVTIGWVKAYKNENDRTYIQMVERRIVGGNTIFNSLSLGINADGSRSVSVSEAAAWLSALGLTPTAWGTDKVAKYKKQGSVVTVTWSGTNTDVSVPPNTWTAVATLPSGYRPSTNIYGVAYLGSAHTCAMRIATDGTVYVMTNTSTPTVGSGASLRFNMTFII